MRRKKRIWAAALPEKNPAVPALMRNFVVSDLEQIRAFSYCILISIRTKMEIENLISAEVL